MKPKSTVTAAFLTAALFTINGYPAEPRPVPPQPETGSFNVKFNGDSIKGQYLILDFRSDEEKNSGVIDGDPILFLHGHSQRPEDGYPLTSKLASLSRSGVVVIPVCDTPYGRDPAWRGDRGKDVILMAMARELLGKCGLAVQNYAPLTDMEVLLDDKPVTVPESAVSSRITVMGWSHGALLSRRIAHAYTDSVTSLVQMAPAGYVQWGGENCTGPACLLTRFSMEGVCIGGGIFRGEAAHIFDSGFGVTKGISGDTFRSCTSCISGNFHPAKPFRMNLDTKGCSAYANDENLPVPDLKYITVIFARDDSLFQAEKHAGIKNGKKPTPRETEAFWSKFYPSAVASGTELTLAVLPGNHIGPIVHGSRYAELALRSAGQKR
jgi:pimeloyl-ACP methyl ester carboxylesterase